MDKLSPLASVSATREVLQSHGLATKYTYGQNFLINDGILDRILRLADVGADDVVLEVGPGIGTLTIPLLKTARRVISVERDEDLIPVLRETCAPWQDRFALISGDALHLNQSDIREALGCLHVDLPLRNNDRSEPIRDFAGSQPKHAVDILQHGQGQPLTDSDTSQSVQGCNLPGKFVSNLPYEVAATLVLDYFQRFDFIQSATVMVQKEVADRMRARPGSKNYGAYTVKLGLFAQPVGSFPVGAENFFPPPRVDSTVIRLDRVQLKDKKGKPLSPDLLALACLMADAAFAHRRKTLSNSFKVFFTERQKHALGEGQKSVKRETRRSQKFSEPADHERTISEAGFDLDDEHAIGEVNSDQAAIDCIQQSLSQIFDGADIDSKRRGETLSQDEFIALAESTLSVLRTG